MAKEEVQTRLTKLYRTCTSSLYTSTYSQLEPEFGASRLVCTLGLSLFVAGLGTGPMVLSPLSEVRLDSLLSDHPSQKHFSQEACQVLTY